MCLALEQDRREIKGTRERERERKGEREKRRERERGERRGKGQQVRLCCYKNHCLIMAQ
jgi:hypothetical protein